MIILDADVHCIAVLALLSPSLSPWRVRERVWRELGELRLLHLLENPILIRSMWGLLKVPEGNKVTTTAAAATATTTATATATAATAVTAVTTAIATAAAATTTTTATATTTAATATAVTSTVTPRNLRTNPTMLLVSKTICDSLTSLRSDGDRNFLIVSVGLYHAASSIFTNFTNTTQNNENHHQNDNYGYNGNDGTNLVIVNTSQFRLLSEFVSDLRVDDWVLMGLLLAADSFLFREKENEKDLKVDDKEDNDADENVGRKDKNDVKSCKYDKNKENDENEKNDENDENDEKEENETGRVDLTLITLNRYHRKRMLLNELPVRYGEFTSLIGSLLGRGVVVLPLVDGRSVSLKEFISIYRPHLL